MMCSSALNGGHAASTLPSSKYCRATRACASTIASTPAANWTMSCFSGRSISSVNTAAGVSKIRPRNRSAKSGVMR